MDLGLWDTYINLKLSANQRGAMKKKESQAPALPRSLLLSSTLLHISLSLSLSPSLVFEWRTQDQIPKTRKQNSHREDVGGKEKTAQETSEAWKRNQKK